MLGGISSRVVGVVTFYNIKGKLLWEGGFEQVPKGDEGADPVEGMLAEERAGATSRSKEPVWLLCQGSAQTAPTLLS